MIMGRQIFARLMSSSHVVVGRVSMRDWRGWVTTGERFCWSIVRLGALLTTEVPRSRVSLGERDEVTAGLAGRVDERAWCRRPELQAVAGVELVVGVAFAEA